MPTKQEEIVQRMIDAGESEENIATVIRSFKSAPVPEVVDTPIQAEVTPEIEQEPEQGWLSKAWSTVSEPLTDLPSRFASSIADYITEPSNEDDTYWSGLKARAKGFGAGALQGIGDLASGLTSPINLATAVLSGGVSIGEKSGLGQIANTMRMGAKATSIPVIGHGAYETLNPESTMGERGQGLVEIAGGLAGLTGSPSVQEESPFIKNIEPEIVNKPTKKITATPNLTEEIVNKDTGEVTIRPISKPPNKPPIKGELLSPEQLDPDIPIQERKSVISEPSKLQQLYDLPRGLMSVDLPFMTSAVFRQASPLAWTKDWFKAWGKAASGFKSEDAYNTIMDSISKNKYAKPKYEPIFNKEGNVKSYKEKPSFSEESGLSLTDLGNISKREETLRSHWAEQIPGYGKYVKASNRAYTAFLNDLRVNKFTQLIDEAKAQGNDPEKNLMLAHQIADFVNSATGRGKLELGVGGKNINLEQNSKLLTNTLFSPRLMASRIKFLNPSTYYQVEPQVRKEFIKGLARSIGTWWGLASLAEMAGAQVSKDPNNADFGKIKIDNTRIDPGAGFQQYLVLLSRQGSGKFTSSTTGKTSVMGEGFKPRTRLSTAEEFMANKLHPVARLAYDLMNAGRSNPVPLGDRTMQLALPMFTQDLMQAAQEEPELGALIAPLSSVGFGTQTYEPGSFGKPTFIPSEYDFQVGGK